MQSLNSSYWIEVKFHQNRQLCGFWTKSPEKVHFGSKLGKSCYAKIFQVKVKVLSLTNSFE